jgi:hypothetical protein
MDIQTRKLNLITYLSELKDENVFEKIEEFIFKKFEKKDKIDLKPFTVNEFENRIEKSEEDFKNGRIKTQEELENISSNW